MFASLMMRCLAVTLCASVASAQTVAFSGSKTNWVSDADKAAAYLAITLSGTLTGYKLYIIDVDHDGGCGASDNDGKILAVVDTLASDTATCSTGTLVTFDNSWKGCETLAYEAPTPTTDVHRIRMFLSDATVTLPGSGRAASQATITTLMGDSQQQDICFKSGSTASTACTCEATAAIEIDTATRSQWTKAAAKTLAYPTLKLTGAEDYTMYIIDVDAANGCNQEGNTGYVHAIVKNLKMSAADGVTCASGTKVDFANNAMGCEDTSFAYVKPTPPDNTNEHTYKIYITDKTITDPTSRGAATALTTALDTTTTGKTTESTEICFDFDNAGPVSCDCSYIPPAAVAFSGSKTSWVSDADKAAAYLAITLSGDLTGYKLYIIDVDHDGGCGASDNDGKILAVVDTLAANTARCSSGTLVTFDNSWKGCETLAYEAPTITTDVHRIRMFLSDATVTLPGSGRAASQATITTLMGNSQQQDICFKSGSTASTACTCEATAALAIDTTNWNKDTSKADVYNTLTLTGANDYKMYIVDVDASNGCNREGNTGYVHAIVKDLKMSAADGVTCASGTKVDFANNAMGCEVDTFAYANPAPPNNTHEHTYKVYVTNKTPTDPTSRGAATALTTALDVADSGEVVTKVQEICFDYDNNSPVSCNCSYVAPTSSTSAVTTAAPTTTSGASFTSLSVASSIFAGVCLVAA